MSGLGAGEVIEGLAAELVSFTGQGGEHTAALNKLAILLRRMANDHELIPRVLSEYRDNIGALGTWVMETREQPFQIDYLLVASPEQKLPRGEPTFIQRAVHELRAFLGSFSYRYDLVGDLGLADESAVTRQPLRVWIAGGRDQAQALKQMIEDSFTPETGIPVELELVPELSNLLIQATIAGTGPDVAMGLQIQDPINFAIRGAVTDLTKFPDFPEVAARFKKSAFTTFRFRDSVYALPSAQSFPVMFYRKDILAEFGLEVPETWDDLYRILPVLQKNNMSVGLGSGSSRPGCISGARLCIKKTGSRPISILKWRFKPLPS